MNIEKFNAFLEKRIALGERQLKESRVAKSYWSGFVSALKDVQNEVKAMSNYERSALENTEYDYGHNISHNENQ